MEETRWEMMPLSFKVVDIRTAEKYYFNYFKWKGFIAFLNELKLRDKIIKKIYVGFKKKL